MSADDFADFEAGYNGAKFGAQPSQSYADDFSAEDFAPPAPEKPESSDR